MVTSTDKTHFTEVIAGIIAVLGLGAGILAWWFGSAVAESAGIAVGFFVTSGMFAIVGQGLRTGKMGVKGGSIYRETSPVKFWGFAIFYLLLGGLFFLGFLFLILLSL